MSEQPISEKTMDSENIEKEYKQALINYSVVASAIGFIPFLPVADYWLLAPLQVSMIATISRIYNYKIDGEKFIKMVGGTLGFGLIFKSISVIINRFVPLVGWVINAGVAFAGTYAIGILARNYIKANGHLSEESIKDIWEKSYAEGKEEFLNFKNYIFEKKDNLLKEFKKYSTENKENSSENFENKKSTEETPNETETHKKTSRKKKKE